MKKSNSNYLIDRLEEGKKINITLLSHNAYWYEIQKLDRHYENCNVQVFGDGISYIKLADMERILKMEDSDLIIWYSSRPYNEIELEQLKNMAFEISNNKNKRVSIGYLYSIPVEERTDAEIMEMIKIISYYGDKKIEKEIYLTSSLTVSDLTNMILETTENKKGKTWYPELWRDIDINLGGQQDDNCKTEYNWLINPVKGRQGRDDEEGTKRVKRRS